MVQEGTRVVGIIDRLQLVRIFVHRNSVRGRRMLLEGVMGRLPLSRD